MKRLQNNLITGTTEEIIEKLAKELTELREDSSRYFQYLGHLDDDIRLSLWEDERIHFSKAQSKASINEEFDYWLDELENRKLLLKHENVKSWQKYNFKKHDNDFMQPITIIIADLAILDQEQQNNLYKIVVDGQLLGINVLACLPGLKDKELLHLFTAD